MRQTLAIMIDSFRELRHRMLFWICNWLSVLVVAIFACVGINEKGLTLLWWQTRAPLTTSLLSPADFYLMLYGLFGVGIWLSYGAVGLALISTASITPDFLTAGTVELSLARPISRARLFLTKYLAGLLFVVMQVLVFSLSTILVIGLRAGEWVWIILVAVPIVTLAFSYLYAFGVLIATLTRSSVAALLGMGVLWGLVMIFTATESTLLNTRVEREIIVERYERSVQTRQLQLDTELELVQEKSPKAKSEEELRTLQRELSSLKERAHDARLDLESTTSWHRLSFHTRAVLPKTYETLELVTKVMKSEESFFRVLSAIENNSDGRAFRNQENGSKFRPSHLEVISRAKKEADSRGLIWVIATSIVFEGLCLFMATWTFCRRDY